MDVLDTKGEVGKIQSLSLSCAMGTKFGSVITLHHLVVMQQTASRYLQNCRNNTAETVSDHKVQRVAGAIKGLVQALAYGFNQPHLLLIAFNRI